MKPRLYINIGKFFLNLGWFPGNEWALLDIDILSSASEWMHSKISMIVIFGVRILKFEFCFGLDFEEKGKSPN